MSSGKGTRVQDIKTDNQLLVLKYIATHRLASRVDIANATGLTKMSVSNMVSDLIAAGIIRENTDSDALRSCSQGRKPVAVELAAASPCICGILLKRRFFQLIISDLSGTIYDSEKCVFNTVSSSEELLQMLYEKYLVLVSRTDRRVSYIGISAFGPLDSRTGIILHPANFFGIHDIRITQYFEARTHVPVFLINDASAGALAEKLYGQARDIHNFIYLHIMQGIGTGLVLQDRLYEGNDGLSGEIGHTSINYSGPQCECGNRGCLEMYANEENMRSSARELGTLHPSSPILSIKEPSWEQFIDNAAKGDALSQSVLEEFCTYVSYALINVLNILNLSTVIVGYTNPSGGETVENILRSRLTHSLQFRNRKALSVLHSSFDENAPLIGSVACIADKIFTGELPYINV